MKKPQLPHLQKPTREAVKAALGTKSFRVGGYSVAAAALVVAAAVAANVLVNALPTSVTQWDLTAASLYTLSQQTKELLDGLEEEVTVYWVVQSGKEDDTLSTLLDRYAAASDKLTVTKKDPDVSPGFVEEYVTGNIYNNSLIVVSGTRDTYVSYEDIYTYDYSDDYTSYNTNFAGESCLTSAIDYVTRESLPKLYRLTGHGETALTASFQSAVEQQNVALEDLSLLTSQTVPEDADALLLSGPQKDISEAEKDAILTYLQGGGDLIVLTDPAQDGVERPNLEALLSEYGMDSVDGIVVEGNASYYALGSPVYLLPSLDSHTITAPLREGGYSVLLSLAQGITIREDLRDTLTVSPLLSTSDDAYAKADGYGMTTYSQEEGDTPGPFTLAAAATETAEDGTESHVVWIGSTALLDDTYNQKVAGANQDFFLNCVSWTCQGEEGPTIHAKSMTTEYLTMSAFTASLLTLVVVAVLPGGCLAWGLSIWIKRRRS